MVLNSIIKAGLPDFDVKRADDFGTPDMITDKVIEAIFTYELVVADLTGHNPNVFYEVGLRHMISKPIIPIKGDNARLPFDNIGINTIFYNIANWDSHVMARDRISTAAEQVLTSDYKITNPVTHAKGYMDLSKSKDPKDAVISQLLDKVAAMENNFASKIDALERHQRALTIGVSSGAGVSRLGSHSPNALSALRGVLDDVQTPANALSSSSILRNFFENSPASAPSPPIPSKDT